MWVVFKAKLVIALVFAFTAVINGKFFACPFFLQDGVET